MRPGYVILLIACCFAWAACKKSTFIADENNSLVPAYTETGNNIAGCLLNDTAWRCSLQPCFACTPWRFNINTSLSGDSTIFRFQGLYTSGSIRFIDSSSNNIPTEFIFVIKGLNIKNQDSLLKLNNQIFQLDTTNGYGSIVRFNQQLSFNKGAGTFTINRVQKGDWESGDGSAGNPKIYRFIISGHFQFTTRATRLYIVKEGRFDMEVYLNSNFSITN